MIPAAATVQSWTGASSDSRPSTGSPARTGDSAGCRRTRWRVTCSGGSCRGGGRATSSCATAPGSTSTSAPTRSTRRPSATRVADVVVHDRAGERILEGLLVDAEKRLHDEGIAGEIYLFKNNTDSAGNSYGCHENYLVSRHGEFGRLADILIPFLVTRQLICGAGKVLQTPRGAVYCLSQRAEHIWEGVSSATTRSRPIINTRDEPHADAERYRRLHVIVGDSNMNEVTTLLKVGTRRHRAAHDRGRRGDARPDPGEPDPGHPRGVARRHRPAQGPAGQRQGVQRAGDPAGVLRQGDRVRRAARRPTRVDQAGPRPVGPGAGRGRDRRPGRGRARDRLGHQAASSSSGTRPSTTWRCRTRGSRRWTWPTTTCAATGASTRCWRRSGQVDRVASDLEIFEAKETPPQTTRARLRGEFIRHAQEKRRDFTVDWVHLKLNDQAQRTVLCKDPFRAYDERVERLIASM